MNRVNNKMYLIILGFTLQFSCIQNERIETSADGVCDSDSIDVYCLVNNYYVPINSFKEIPLKMQFNSRHIEYFYYLNYENVIFSFLRDSFHFSNSDFEFDAICYDSHLNRFSYIGDTSTFIWEKSKLKNVDFICKNEIDSFNLAVSKLSFSESNKLFTSLFGKGYVSLSRPLMSKNGKLILIVEEVVNNTDVYQTPVFVFFRYTNNWHVRKFHFW